MTAPQAGGELGQALLALEQRLGSRAALAAAVGVRKQAIARWTRGDNVPDARCAEKLVELEPTLRPLLESKRAFVERRKRPPLGKGALTRQQARPPTLIPVPPDEQPGLAEEWQDEQPTRDLRPMRRERGERCPAS